MHKKQEELKKYLESLNSTVIAFSGGVDSSYLLKTAHDVLGDRVIAVTVRSCFFPERETGEAVAFCESRGIRHIIYDIREHEFEAYADNPENRCYLCKKELFKNILSIARENEVEHVAEGTNKDDESDYRPGMQAIKELGVKSPLRHVGFTKAEIRSLSEEQGLPTWNKQSFACLATRLPYGERITAKKLSMIDLAEQELFSLGIKQFRVRYHSGALARIETDDDGFRLLLISETRKRLYTRFREIGFAYTSLDLMGYRTGSMNEMLNA